MEYIIGALAGAILFASGIFLARFTERKAPPPEPDKEELTEADIEYLRQYNNWMQYDGRPQR